MLYEWHQVGLQGIPFPKWVYLRKNVRRTGEVLSRDVMITFDLTWTMIFFIAGFHEFHSGHASVCGVTGAVFRGPAWWSQWVKASRSFRINCLYPFYESFPVNLPVSPKVFRQYFQQECLMWKHHICFFFLQFVEEKVKLYDIIIWMIMQNQVCLGLLYVWMFWSTAKHLQPMCVETSKGLKLAIPYHDPIVTGDPFVVPRLKWIGFQELGFD